MRPKSLAEVVERTRRNGEWDHHLREFLDAFYGADGHPIVQAEMVATDPGWLGVARADAFLGGAAEHLARRWRFAIPEWVREDQRYLSEAMFVPDEKPLRGYLIGASPVSFRTRLIFTGPEPLQRARFPRHHGVLSLPLDFPVRPHPPAA